MGGGGEREGSIFSLAENRPPSGPESPLGGGGVCGGLRGLRRREGLRGGGGVGRGEGIVRAAAGVAAAGVAAGVIRGGGFRGAGASNSPTPQTPPPRPHWLLPLPLGRTLSNSYMKL